MNQTDEHLTVTHDEREHRVFAFSVWLLWRKVQWRVNGLSGVVANSGPGPLEEGRDLRDLRHIKRHPDAEPFPN